MRIYLTNQLQSTDPSKATTKQPAPSLPAEEEIIADGSAGAFEATEIVSEEDLHPHPTHDEKISKDYY
ncbi:hypothetical protein [Chitinophaga costaii]|nr:hypothetical protein [Chitinophaga costaii]